MIKDNLFGKKLKVINIGLESFKDALDKCGVESVQVDWHPPAPVTEKSSRIITANLELIDKANAEVMKKILAGKPALVGMGKALDTVPGMKPNLILHAGPPITWDRMCGPMRGAVVGALII
jgi:hypothetical protein